MVKTMDTLRSLLKVHIDFDQSHLFFPNLIHWLLFILLVAIVVFQGIPYARDVANGKRKFVFVPPDFDALRFFGTLGLTVAYVVAMDWVGSLYPNRGVGFLSTSMVYVFVLGLLYFHDFDRRKLLAIVANAVAAPLIAWYVLGHLFRITLP
jgi:putative tricarboxylic transport membrane protein